MSEDTSTRVTIVDYGSGNLHSLKNAFERIGVAAHVTSRPADILSAHKLVLPGVGHFGAGMLRLRELNLVEPLAEAVTVKRTPILGICLGLHFLARSSEEGHAEGLGFIDAKVVRFDVSDTVRYKVPHVGWNTMPPRRPSVLLDNVDPAAEFYFVHAYHVVSQDRDIVASETRYSYPFASVIEQDNVFGIQPHPEKSHEAGATLLKNFASL